MTWEYNGLKPLTEYKGLKVIQADIHKSWNKDALASYNRKTEIITVYKDFYNRGDVTRKRAMYHEYTHHVFSKMTLVYKAIWRLISNWKLLPILNAFWITSCTNNAFAREYWKTNYKEDFATCGEEIERQRVQSERVFHTFADFKLSVVKSLLNKYTKDHE